MAAAWSANATAIHATHAGPAIDATARRARVLAVDPTLTVQPVRDPGGVGGHGRADRRRQVLVPAAAVGVARVANEARREEQVRHPRSRAAREDVGDAQTAMANRDG